MISPKEMFIYVLWCLACSICLCILYYFMSKIVDIDDDREQ
jgi:hypothetical protein